MLKYIFRRILMMFVVILGVIFITFTLNRISPGDPVIAILGAGYTQEEYDRVAEDLGVNKSFVEQLIDYYKGIFTELDLGISYQTKIAVSKEIGARFWTTVKLGLMGILLTLVLGIPIGIISAVKQYSAVDYASTVLSMLFASMPNFWFALMLMLLFSYHWGILPASGLETWQAWILPVVALGLNPIASVIRMTRSSMLDVIRQDYITTARAKGLPESKVITKHQLRNALIPIITLVGMQLGHIVGGAVVIETIFSIPGMGLLMLTGINSADYPIVQGCVLVISATVCIMNILVDIAYAMVDPRLKSQYGFGEGKKKASAKEVKA